MVNDFFSGEKVWRVLANFWTFMLAVFLLINFFSQNQYEYLTPAFSIIYTGVLGLYIGTKEFERWYERYEDRHPGEWFIIGWTVLIAFLFGMRFLLGSGYPVSSEAVADYIMVLSMFAITQKSKGLHKKRGR